MASLGAHPTCAPRKVGNEAIPSSNVCAICDHFHTRSWNFVRARTHTYEVPCTPPRTSLDRMADNGGGAVRRSCLNALFFSNAVQFSFLVVQSSYSNWPCACCSLQFIFVSVQCPAVVHALSAHNDKLSRTASSGINQFARKARALAR